MEDSTIIIDTDFIRGTESEIEMFDIEKDIDLIKQKLNTGVANSISLKILIIYAIVQKVKRNLEAQSIIFFNKENFISAYLKKKLNESVSKEYKAELIIQKDWLIWFLHSQKQINSSLYWISRERMFFLNIILNTKKTRDNFTRRYKTCLPKDFPKMIKNLFYSPLFN